MNPKVLGWALFVSLGANIFLLGAWTGDHFADSPPPAPGPNAHGPKHPSHQQGPPRPKRSDGERHERGRGGRHGPPTLWLLRGLVHVMGGPDDPRVQGVLVHERGRKTDRRQEIFEAQQKVQDALLAEPFDDQALRDAFAAVSARTGSAQDKAQEQIVSLAKELTPEERKKLALHFSEQKKRFREHDHSPSERRSGPPESPRPPKP